MLRAWLAFALFGAVDALVLLEFPTAGVLLGVLGLAAIAARPPRGAALAGLMTGVGASWTGVIGRVWLTCTGFGPRAGTTGEAPGIEGWVWLGAGMFAIGVIASVAVVVRMRRISRTVAGRDLR